MTNQMKKHPNTRVSKDVPFPSSSVSDPDMPTLKELQAWNEELEHCLWKYKGTFYLSKLLILIFKIFYRQTEIGQRRNHTHPQT